MNGWKEHKWGEIATLEYGKGLANYQNDNGKYPVFGTNGKIGTSDIFLNSDILIDQIRAIDNKRFVRYLATVPDDIKARVKGSLSYILDLED